MIRFSGIEEESYKVREASEKDINKNDCGCIVTGRSKKHLVCGISTLYDY